MSKSIAYFVSLLLILFAAQGAFAQMRSDPSGTWAGPLATDAGPGGLEITLSRAGAEWQATMKLRHAGEEVRPTVRDLKIEHEDISFSFDLDHNFVKVAGKFAGDKLIGTVAAFRGDEKIGGGTFTLTFGGQIPALRQQAVCCL